MEVGLRMGRDLGLFLLSLKLLCALVQSNGSSPPGKPTLLGCRSPEKETFSCWWQPGSSGGLPTTHRLYYERERLQGTHECPDYQSAGQNSCFFNKSHTFIWVDYNLTVVAHNALGNTTSDTFKVDVMDILKPNAPENVTVQVEEKEHATFLHMSWERPPNTDTESGWVTFKYQVRVKQGNNNQWKEYTSGTQTHFSLFSLSPGGVYVVQVRCRIDHGSWSKWSNATCVTVPGRALYNSDLQNGKAFWILVYVLSAILLIASMWILVMKRNCMSRCILPPVPGPKIRGVDLQRLKSRRPEDINTLTINQNFPLMAAWKEQMEEYLIVTENDNKLLSDASNVQRMKQSPVSLLGCGLDFKRQHEELMAFQGDTEEAVKTENDQYQESLSYTKVSQVPSGKWESGLNFATVETTDMGLPVNHLNPAANSGYVDILTQLEEELDLDGGKMLNGDDAHHPTGARAQEANPSADYSRVREVGAGHTVFLQRHSEPVYSRCREKEVNDASATTTTVTRPREPQDARAGTGTGLVDSGYVDTVPETASV